MKKPKHLYLRTTADKYEFPLAVADTAKELAEMIGVKRDSVLTMISHKKKGWYRIELTEEDIKDIYEECDPE